MTKSIKPTAKTQEKSKIKLIVFDMDGTVFKKTYKDSHGNTAPSIWTLIAEHLGPEALKEEEYTKEKWTDGEYASYVEWMEDTIKIHQKYGLTKDFFEKVANKVQYYDGVKEVFDVLEKAGVRTALISGSFKYQADKALVDLKIDHAYSACEYFWDKNGKLLHWNLLPSDYEAKATFMSILMKEHKLKKEEVAFVGDGRNDIPLAKIVGTSIAFNGAKELQAVCTNSVNQPEGKEDFRAVLPILGFGK